jgi:sulfate adenylyltransferase
VRDEAREMSKGNFVEVYCETPLDVCESRDVKGFYARARAAVAEGKPMGFTGVDDPYEPPLHPEVTLDTSKQSARECADAIIEKLRELGYLLPHGRIAD